MQTHYHYRHLFFFFFQASYNGRAQRVENFLGEKETLSSFVRGYANNKGRALAPKNTRELPLNIHRPRPGVEYERRGVRQREPQTWILVQRAREVVLAFLTLDGDHLFRV